MTLVPDSKIYQYIQYEFETIVETMKKDCYINPYSSTKEEQDSYLYLKAFYNNSFGKLLKGLNDYLKDKQGGSVSINGWWSEISPSDKKNKSEKNVNKQNHLDLYKDSKSDKEHRTTLVYKARKNKEAFLWENLNRCQESYDKQCVSEVQRSIVVPKENEELLNKLKSVFPEYAIDYSTVSNELVYNFKYILLHYLASDSTKPLVVHSKNFFRILWCIIADTADRLRGVTHELVVTPQKDDYELCQFGMWEPFPDSGDVNIKDFIHSENALRSDKIGFFHLGIEDYSLNMRDFKKLITNQVRKHKTVILIDPYAVTPQLHWLYRLLDDGILLDYTEPSSNSAG